MERLLRAGFNVYVIAPVDKYLAYKDRFPEVIHVPLKKLSRKSTRPIKDLLLLMELYRIYRKIRPDLVLHYTVKPNIYGGIAAGILEIPSIAVVTGLGYAFIHKGWIKEITMWLYRISSKFHQKFIFENEDDRSLFQEAQLIRPNQGVSIKGCGVNTTKFHPMPRSAVSDKITFAFIGRLLYDKGLKEYTQAAAMILKKHPNAMFWIIGEIDNGNPAAIKIQDLKRWLIKEKIEYLGFQENIREYISLSDCIVLPSYREGIARSLTEAMAMGKPVIACDAAGSREAVENGKNGYLVPIKDEMALAQAMEKFILLPEPERKAMGEYGREKALREFDDRQIAEAIYTIITEILTAPPK